MVDEKKPPADGGDADKGTDKGTPQAPLNVPEKFKGKSAEEITKAYIELETKLGDQSKTVEEAKKLQEQTDTLLRSIYADPDLFRQVEKGIEKYTTGGMLPDTKKIEKPKCDEGVDRAKETPPIDDLRRAQENQILNAFYAKYGYQALPDKERKDSFTRLALAVAELVDPGGKKPIKEILATIPMDKLPRYLENAHFLANKDKIVEQAKRSALLDKETNDSATIGSFAASSGQGASQGVKLTNREREMAQKLGISEEAYAKRKATIEEEAKSFER